MHLSYLPAVLDRAAAEGWTHLALLGPGHHSHSERLLIAGFPARAVVKFHDRAGTRFASDIVGRALGLSNLRHLSAIGLDVGDANTYAFAALAHLTSLDLTNNNIGPSGVSPLAGLKLLTSLNLSTNRIGVGGVHTISSLDGLRDLDVTSNDLDAIPRALRGLTKLISLRLGNNPRLGLPEELEHVTDAKRLLDWYFGPPSETKIILIGEGSVGKTYLAHALRRNAYSLLHLKALLLGDGGVGKSWLFSRTLGRPLPHDEHVPTQSFEWSPLAITAKHDGKDHSLTCRLFDFGGQPYLFGAHRLFLASRRNIFIIVVNSRLDAQRNRLTHWLDLVDDLATRSQQVDMARHSVYAGRDDQPKDYEFLAHFESPRILIVATHDRHPSQPVLTNDDIRAHVQQWKTKRSRGDSLVPPHINILDPIDTKDDGEAAARIISEALSTAAKATDEIWRAKFPASFLSALERIDNDFFPDAHTGSLKPNIPPILTIDEFRARYFTDEGAEPDLDRDRIWLQILRNLGVIIWEGDRVDALRSIQWVNTNNIAEPTDGAPPISDEAQQIANLIFCPAAVRDALYKILWLPEQQVDDGWASRSLVTMHLREHLAPRIDPSHLDSGIRAVFSLLKLSGVLYESRARPDDILIVDLMPPDPGPRLTPYKERREARPRFLDDAALPRFIGERIDRRDPNFIASRNGFVLLAADATPRSSATLRGDAHPDVSDLHRARAAIRAEHTPTGPRLVIETAGHDESDRLALLAELQHDLEAFIGADLEWTSVPPTADPAILSERIRSYLTFGGGKSTKSPRAQAAAAAPSSPAIPEPRLDPNTPARLFISYAHADTPFCRAFDESLAGLRNQSLIQPWHDGMLNPGDKWNAAIAEQLLSAHLIVLLVSASFLNSKYIYGNELNIALERDARGEARLIPVIIRKCDWEQEPFARNNVLPLTDTRQPLAVSAWTDPDDAWTRVAKGLRNLLSELRHRPR